MRQQLEEAAPVSVADSGWVDDAQCQPSGEKIAAPGGSGRDTHWW